MIKKELRKLYKEKRQSLSFQSKSRLDDLLLIQFQQLYFEQLDVLFSYWPMEHTAEPDTSLFNRYLLHMIPGLQIAYPSSDFEKSSMEAIIINEETDYQKNRYGITEPVHGEVVDPLKIDMVFIPMLICDMQGYRVGYGKGFYDRYLAQCRPDLVKIGFSYFDPIDKIEDTHQFDVPLNYCVTPEHIYEFDASSGN